MLAELENYKGGTVTENSVLRDETDKQLAEVSADANYKQFGLFDENAKWNGAIFRYSTISDVSFNKVIEASILPQNPWFSNTIDRTTQLENFRNEVFKAFASARDTGTKTHSSVYLPVARELKRLSESKSNVRRLFIYSDLMENRPDLSFYSETQFKMLIEHPDYVLKKFNEWMPLPSLVGIEVHLIYQPADVTTDKYFRTVSEFYGKMLEAKGAKVIIEANLQN
jgi:hypothetical protein